jgi:hypothetical protein
MRRVAPPESGQDFMRDTLPSRRVIHAIEVAVVAFIISSKAVTWLIYVCSGSPGSPGQLTTAPDAMILRNLQYIALIWFMAWRNSERLSMFGLCRPKFAADILIGVGVFLIAKAMEMAVIYIQMTESHVVDIASNISTSTYDLIENQASSLLSSQ